VKGTSIEDVKQPQSNPLQRELARGKSTEPHPYEDVLAAFAENTFGVVGSSESVSLLPHIGSVDVTPVQSSAPRGQDISAPVCRSRI
jgi:hypothetical protein